MRQTPLDPLRWAIGVTAIGIGASVAAMATTDVQALPIGLACLLLILVGNLSRVYRFGDIVGLLIGCGAYVVVEQDRGSSGLTAWVAATAAFGVTVAVFRFVEERIRVGEAHIERGHQVAEDLTLTDLSSHLLKRRYGELALEEEVTRARRTNTELCLVLVEVDTVNIQPLEARQDDEEEAAVIGEVFHSQLRSCDRSARFGPALFAAILPATNAEGGSIVAQKLRQGAEQPGHYQIRCAIAAFPRHAVSATELMEEAEAALGLARAAGLTIVSPSMLHNFAVAT
ncbi:MAG: response receiver-modulated diguanylate cyclase [Chloroflexi bacterium]|jgi:diguanylate cyclase (GGDEF)-like protein|nr:response receiver-modulated diguanylate cyclase [Chloroflexota bacterium]MDB5076787.1 response receiver-modulated diguanylate cyclase [Chloroflexota bacterium]